MRHYTLHCHCKYLCIHCSCSRTKAVYKGWPSEVFRALDGSDHLRKDPPLSQYSRNSATCAWPMCCSVVVPHYILDSSLDWKPRGRSKNHSCPPYRVQCPSNSPMVRLQSEPVQKGHGWMVWWRSCPGEIQARVVRFVVVNV